MSSPRAASLPPLGVAGAAGLDPAAAAAAKAEAEGNEEAAAVRQHAATPAPPQLQPQSDESEGGDEEAALEPAADKAAGHGSCAEAAATRRRLAQADEHVALGLRPDDVSKASDGGRNGKASAAYTRKWKRSPDLLFSQVVRRGADTFVVTVRARRQPQAVGGAKGESLMEGAVQHFLMQVCSAVE